MQKNLTLIVTVFAVIILSIFLGTAVGSADQTTPIIAVSVLVVVMLWVGLKEDIWILIPIFAAWTGRMPILPIPFSLSNMVVLFVVGTWILSIATRRQQFRFQFTRIEFVIILTLALLAIGYFRNPVTFAAFTNGSNIGGRPYAEVGIAVAGFVVLSMQQTRLSLVAGLPKWVLLSMALLGAGGALAVLVPQVGIVLYQFYAGFIPDTGDMMSPYEEQTGVGRLSFVRPLAYGLAAYVGAKVNPFSLLRPQNWGLLLALMFATVLALLSGYRSALVTVAFYFVVASWIWLRGVGPVICGFIGLLFLSVAIAVQSLVPLPDKVQRSLSFLPGPWDQRIVKSGEDSTAWRVEMWENIVEGDSVKNWWIGDGFGFPRSEYEYFGYLQMSGQIRSDQLAEYYTLTGRLHSGPLSAAKFAGVIGAILYVVLATMIAMTYLKNWKLLRGREDLRSLQVTIGFFGLAATYLPIKFVFIFGAYNNDLAALILSAGICRLLDNFTKKELMAENEEALEASEPVGLRGTLQT